MLASHQQMTEPVDLVRPELADVLADRAATP